MCCRFDCRIYGLSLGNFPKRDYETRNDKQHLSLTLPWIRQVLGTIRHPISNIPSLVRPRGWPVTFGTAKTGLHGSYLLTYLLIWQVRRPVFLGGDSPVAVEFQSPVYDVGVDVVEHQGTVVTTEDFTSTN